LTERERAELKHLQESKRSLSEYRYDAQAYIEDWLEWSPWSGSSAEFPGQVEVIEAYTHALRQQHERDDFEAGRVDLADLKYWKPGEVIQNRIRIAAGHTVGKTKLASGLVNHFFDCFPPAIIYTYAPSWDQIKDLLWKEIGTDREGKGLPGRVLETCEIKYRKNHFAKGRATNNAGGTGTERVQGQHGKYLMFVLDEAEGVADFVFQAIDSMTSGGISIVIMLANPKTRLSLFHKAKDRSDTKSFRISCVGHVNVLAGREIVPGAVKRDYVRQMVELHTEVVDQHNEDEQTFTLPFDVTVKGKLLPEGTIFRPFPEFLWRVLGIPPTNMADDTLISVGRYEAAKKRAVNQPAECTSARMGVDVSRWGKDAGTLYIRMGMQAWRAAQFWKKDTNVYAREIKRHALELPASVQSLHIRVDGGGGFGGGVIDKLKVDDDLIVRFPDFKVLEVHNNGTPYDRAAYHDLGTEMYAEASETLRGIRLIDPPESLEADLCERVFAWVNVKGIEVKQLEAKKLFKKRKTRSPDDGDGFVLAAAPDHIFGMRELQTDDETFEGFWGGEISQEQSSFWDG